MSDQPHGSARAEIAPLADLRRRYVENLSALYRSDSALAVAVEALPFAALPPLEPARDGGYTARLTADDGRPLYAHSRYRPATEARDLVASQTGAQTGAAARAEAGAAADIRVCVLSGLGLGYVAAALEEQLDRPLVVVFEDDLALVKAALCVTDLAPQLREHRVVFVTRADKSHVHQQLKRVTTDLMLGMTLVTPPTAGHYHAAFQRTMRGLLTDFISYSRMMMVTVLRNARVTFKNIVCNLPTYLRQPGVEVLRDRARGFPAILVAAGPSLARNLDQLAAWRDRAVIIAVQTVFKTLLERGLPPHFVTALDFHEMSAEFFRGVADTGGTILVAEPKVTWHVPDAYRGRVHLLASTFVPDLLRSSTPQRDTLRSGTTVSHLSFYLAEHLGCDPIILLGQDLAFCEALYYAPGMPIERIWQPELHRFHTVEMKQWERIVRSRPILRETVDIHGRPAYTDEQMTTYAEQFQADFAASDRRVIHACEGGMALTGVEVMTFRAAAEKFCTRPLPADLFDVPANPDTAPLLAAAAGELAARLDEIGQMKAISRETSELLARLETLLDRPSEFNRVVARVDDLRNAMQGFDRTYTLVSAVAQQAELRRYSADRRLGTVEHETTDTARRRLVRDREFVTAFLDACEYLEGVLPMGRDRLREVAS